MVQNACVPSSTGFVEKPCIRALGSAFVRSTIPLVRRKEAVRKFATSAIFDEFLDLDISEAVQIPSPPLGAEREMGLVETALVAISAVVAASGVRRRCGDGRRHMAASGSGRLPFWG
jgi:hypothetical protein